MNKTFGASGINTRQRDLANLRERRRMMLINRGFEQLKNRLPIGELIISGETKNSRSKSGAAHAKEQRAIARLTKVDILRLTIEYIRKLRALLAGERVQSSDLQVSCKLEKFLTTSKPRAGHKSLGFGRRAERRRRGPAGKPVSSRRERPMPIVTLIDSQQDSERSRHIGESSETLAASQRLTRAYKQSGPSLSCDTIVQSSRNDLHDATRTYSLSWSRSKQTSGFFHEEEESSQVVVGVAQVKRVLRNTKLWMPERDITAIDD